LPHQEQQFSALGSPPFMAEEESTPDPGASNISMQRRPSHTPVSCHQIHGLQRLDAPDGRQGRQEGGPGPAGDAATKAEPYLTRGRDHRAYLRRAPP
jgi:hypothetical protein